MAAGKTTKMPAGRSWAQKVAGNASPRSPAPGADASRMGTPLGGAVDGVQSRDKLQSLLNKLKVRHDNSHTHDRQLTRIHRTKR